MVIAHSGLCDDVKNTIYQTPAQGQVCWNYMYILIVFHLLSADCKGDRAKSKGTHLVVAGLWKAPVLYGVMLPDSDEGLGQERNTCSSKGNIDWSRGALLLF